MADDDKGQSGGVNISGGTVNVGGDIVGRDKVTTTTTYGIGGDQLAALVKEFSQISKKVDEVKLPADVDKAEVKDTVKKIEEEVKKGDQANGAKVERWLKFLGDMSGDILQVTAATLTNPALGVTKAVQLIAKKAQEEGKK
jgi:hypothetical protein